MSLKKTQAITIGLFVIGLSILSAKPFTVLSETQDLVRVKFTLPEWKLDDVTENNQVWQKISCDEGSVYAIEGYPLLCSFSEAVGIPVNGDINIEIVNQKTKTLSGVSIVPVDKMKVTGSEVEYIFNQNLNAYRQNSLYPPYLTQKGESAYIGDRNLIPLHVYPFQYNAARKELLVTTEAEISIYINGDKRASQVAPAGTNYIDAIGNDFFLNNSTSSAWRKAKPQIQNYDIPKSSNDLVNEVQLIVDKEGIYKITYQYLQEKMNMMMDSLNVQCAWSVNTVDPRYLQLNDENGPVPIHFSGETDGVFNANDYFEFYGDRHYGEDLYQDDYTAENVYTLELTDHLGARLAVENGGLTVSNAANYIVPDAYEHTIHLEEQLIPDKLGRSWELNNNFYREDLWFWKKITAPNLEIIPFELQYPKDTTIRTFSTRISLFGLTYYEGLPANEYDHKASIRLNQSLVSTQEWRDQTEKIFTNDVPLPNSYLHNGTNYYYISLNGETLMGDREQVLLDYIELTYWREYKTSEDFIRFTKPSNRPFGLYQFQLEGFTSNQVSVYKIGSSIFNNMQIEPFTLSGSIPWTVTFQDSVNANDVKYYAVTEDQKKLPKDFRLNIPSSLKSPNNAADCILITASQFVQDGGTLLFKQLWESEGFQVKIIDLQDIFDEFNHGIRSAQPIKDFLSYAYNFWSAPQLKSVVLLGDGTDDERDNSYSRRYNIIPVKKIWTYQHGATASDNWYGCLVGNDPLPDISISRINIWQKDQIIEVAQKSQKYYNEPNFDDLWHGNIILATGGKQTDANDLFSQQSEQIRRTNIPNYYRPSRVYTNTQTVSHDFYGVTTTLMNRINDGAIYLQFMGHGGGRIWADYNLFNFNNVSSLNNDNYPIVTSLACYCSAFDTDAAASISEALVLQPNKGAIATIGFTGLGYLYNDLDFGLALNEGLFMHDFDTLGEAVDFAKAKFYISTPNPSAKLALTGGCALLGDPNIRIIKPQSAINVTTDKATYAISDTMQVSATFNAPVTMARTYVLKPTEIAVNTPNQFPVTGGNYNYSYIFPGSENENYQRKVYVAGYSADGEYYGYKDVSVGRSLLSHHMTIPETPTWSDSVYFQVRVGGIFNISSLVCKVRLDSTGTNIIWTTIPMSRSQSDSTIYQTLYGLPPQTTGDEIFFKYRAVESGGAVHESFLYSSVIAGPELLIEDMKFVIENNELGIKTLIRNIGNTVSDSTTIKLFSTQLGQPETEMINRTFMPLNVNEHRWEFLPVDSTYANSVTFKVTVNVPNLFPEWNSSVANNTATIIVPMNYHTIDNSGGIISSLDNNLTCEVPANLVSGSQVSMFYINALQEVTPQDQPGISQIVLDSGVYSIPYEIGTLDNTLVDSTGVLINNKKFKLTFYYSNTDESTQDNENQNEYLIYRWEPVYSKWIMQGGNISTVDDKVVFEVNRQGIYTLLRNQDRIRPSIDVNVQDQEFTVGGYVSGKGTISLLLSDANGIDVFDNSIKLFLDGVEIPDDQWSKSINPDNINRVPIKYQLNLQKGNYTLVVDCKDVNGNFNTRDVQFIVNDKFDVVNLANYPNPVLGKTQDPKNAGRTRFTYVLTDDADEVNIKVFTVSGRLIKTFKNLPVGVGYHEYPRTVYAWDCTDDKGFYLANGVYFYRIIARKGSKTVEKLQKMAIIK